VADIRPDNEQARPEVGREPVEPTTSRTRTDGGSRLWYLLLLLPFVGLLWVPIYADTSPKLFGFPFFYWYQFAWVPVTALLTWIVFRMVR
jgi:hypothetical protein